MFNMIKEFKYSFILKHNLMHYDLISYKLSKCLYLNLFHVKYLVIKVDICSNTFIQLVFLLFPQKQEVNDDLGACVLKLQIV